MLSRSLPPWCAALAVTALFPGGGSAQEPLTGRVLLGGETVADVPVTLHRVTPDSSGAVAEATTDAAGRFRLPLPEVDSAAAFTVFFATAQYGSVRYFGAPLHPDDPRDGYAVEVFDTASALPGALRLARRDVVLLPHADGGWEVNEIVRIRNAARKTLVSPGGMPTFEIRIPAAATGFEAGEGEVGAEQMRRMGERVLVLSPLVPGDRELFFRYRIPGSGSEAVLPVNVALDTLNLFVQQPSPRLEVSGMTTTDLLEVEGQRFLQFGAVDLPAGGEVELAWESAKPPVSPIVAGAGATLLLLLAGTGAALRNRASPRGGTRANAG